MKAVTLLAARVREMSAETVAATVSAEALKEARRADAEPLFVELIVGHEGVSTGALAGGAGRGRPAQKLWSRERVSELAARLAAGAPVFTGHGGTGRKPVGKILAAAERMVGGALSAAGIALISNPQTKERLRAGELDTCSVEAEVELYRPAGDESWVVGAVRKVTGVALGNRRDSRPGFPGATVLRLIEEFEDGGGAGGSGAKEGEKSERDEAEARPDALAGELKAIRAELARLRDELKAGRGPSEDRRVSLPPERERKPVNPLIPR